MIENHNASRAHTLIHTHALSHVNIIPIMDVSAVKFGFEVGNTGLLEKNSGN